MSVNIFIYIISTQINILLHRWKYSQWELAIKNMFIIIYFNKRLCQCQMFPMCWNSPRCLAISPYARILILEYIIDGNWGIPECSYGEANPCILQFVSHEPIIIHDYFLSFRAFIDYLINTTGSAICLFHLIGHSAGAHLCGVAGALVTSGRIPRITGKKKKIIFVCSF